MFCTRLRKRSEWASIIPKLLESQIPRWKENSLETHDIAIPLPRRDDRGAHVCMLLLSPMDVQSSSNGLARIERLLHIGGGHQIAIVLLLENETTKEGGVIAYMELQASLLSASIEIPIVPLSCVSSLPETLIAYQRQLLRTRENGVSVNPVTHVLPYCTDGAPLPEHSLNVLSDIFRNFKELTTAATTADGKEKIRKWLGEPSPQQAEAVIGFWLQEYVAD